ncbi:hypothetical protein CLAVI_000810 [Candidatus Clavichlamydia salmonicola]|uniref:hypothetical protein n=1 Tax=Candidatus Clavichlamydia salmonicola TaxID=469812 RepID=UPI0018916749|nr:hypothetical protein [Candidatus Clavichlamydia salmonicola]MBF5051172.1 hypothetical protein [Candidatus Clavichlamydia salmonicola]
MKKKAKKKLLIQYSFVFFSGILCSSIVLFPLLIDNSKKGKEIVMKIASKSFGMSISMSSLNLSWFGKQSFSNITCCSLDGTAQFKAELLDLHVSLIGLISHSFPQKISIKNCNYTLKVSKDEVFSNKPLIYDFLKHSRFEISNGSFNINSLEDGTSCMLSEIQANWMKEYGDIKAISSYDRVQGAVTLQWSYGDAPSFFGQVRDFPSVWLKHMAITPLLELVSNTAFIEGDLKTIKKNKDSFIDLNILAGSLKARIKAKIDQHSFIFSSKHPSYIALGAGSKITPFFLPDTLKQFVVKNSKAIRLHITKGFWSFYPFENSVKKKFISFRGESDAISCTAIEKGHADFVLNDLIFTGVISRQKAHLISNFTFENNGYKIPSALVVTKKNKDPWHIELLQKEAKIGAFLPFTKDSSWINHYADLPLCVQLSGEFDHKNMRMKCQCSHPFFTTEISGESTPKKTEVTLVSKIALSPYYSSLIGYPEAHIAFNGQSGMGTRMGPLSFSFDVNAGKNHWAGYGKTIEITDNPFSLKNINLVSHIGCDYLNLEKISPVLKNMELTHGTCSFNFQGKEGIIRGKLEGHYHLLNHSSAHISIPLLHITDYTYTDGFPVFPNASIVTKGFIQNFNPDIFNQLLNINFPFNEYLGTSMKNIFEIKRAPQKKKAFQIKSALRSPDCELSLDLGLDNNENILPNSKGMCIFKLTPEKYALFRKHPSDNSQYSHLSLMNDSVIEAHFSDFSLPKKTDKSFLSRLLKGGLHLELTSSPLNFIEKRTQDKVVITDLKASFSGQTMCRESCYSLTGNHKQKDNASEKSSPFFLNGTVYNLMERDKHALNPGMSIQGAAATENLPYSFLTGLLEAPYAHAEKMKALLGNSIDVKASWDLMQLKGPVTLDLKSPNLHAILPLDVQSDIIRLCDDLKFSFHLNDQIAKAFLKTLNPLIVSGTYSDRFIFFQIDAEDFSFPFKDFEFKNIKINHATLDLGKIYLDNQGQVHKLFEFLKTEDGGEKVEAWFSPLFFSLQNGVLYQRRFDVLLDHKIHIAVWGKTDILNDKLKLTLGIAPSVLQQRFNLTDLAKKDFFQVKMRGSFNHPELDWTSAYARIGILMARSSGGHLGYVVGSLADQLFSVLGDNAPSQTVPVLPWDKSIESP